MHNFLYVSTQKADRDDKEVEVGDPPELLEEVEEPEAEEGVLRAPNFIRTKSNLATLGLEKHTDKLTGNLKSAKYQNQHLKSK